MSALTKMKNTAFSINRLLSLGLLVGASLFSVGCQQSENFVAGQISDAFVQDFNPKYLEVLWVVDDRSPMYNARTQVVSEATKFFTAIDSITARYRMGVVSADMQFAKGQLQPRGTRFILNEGFSQSASERAGVFGGLLANLLNVHTGYQNRGFESAEAALKGEFGAQAGVPLVLVFISFSDDVSTLPAGQTDAVAYYKQKFIDIKGGNAELVKSYSVNYKPLPSGVVYNTPESISYRCAQAYDNVIDKTPAAYQDRYFKMAEAFDGSTGDLCALSGFASQLDLEGLTLKELSTRFVLKSIPNTDTLRVRITRKDGSDAVIPEWSYLVSTNEIVFVTAPEAGTTILVSYLPGKK